RVAESTRGREKLEQARRRAAREIVERIDGRKLPSLVHEVLARAWANHLVLPGIERALRQGLVNVAFQPQDIERLLAQLRDWYGLQLGESARGAVPATEVAAAAVAAIPESIQPLVE